MNTNQFWTPEAIKAVGGLWPLALVVLFILILVTVVIFFRAQARTFFDRLQNLIIKRGETEISINQPISPTTKNELLAKGQDPSQGSSKIEEAEVKPDPQVTQPELDMNFEQQMFYHASLGESDKIDEAFQKLQSQTKDPEGRIKNEAQYLRLRFENGDETAQKKLHELEIRAKEFPKMLGLVKRVDALCYTFSGSYSKAAERFKDSAGSCVTDTCKATSMAGASSALYELGLKADAFTLLRETLPKLNDPEAKIAIYLALATLFEREKDQFNHAIVLQQALELQPNSKDLNFKTAYAFANVQFNALAVLHYEKLVQIDPKRAGGLNNLGVAFRNLGCPTLAVTYYKKATNLGETLPAANLAQVLINAGVLEEAAKILKDAQTQKKIHENVNQALVSLDTAGKKDKKTRSENLELAKHQRQFFLEYADALLMLNGDQPPLDGIWAEVKEKAIDFEAEEVGGTLRITWATNKSGSVFSGPKTDTYRFKGKRNGLVASGEVTKSVQPAAHLLTKSEGSFISYGAGYAYFNRNSELKLFLQKANSKDFELLSFRRVS